MTYVEKAAAFVRQHPEGVRTRDVAHAVGQDTSNVDGSLRMAKKRGLIERRGRMWFPAGQAPPKPAPIAKPVPTPISMFARKPMIRDLITEVFRANENTPLGASASPAAKLDRPWAGRRDRGGAVMVLGYGAAWPG